MEKPEKIEKKIELLITRIQQLERAIETKNPNYEREAKQASKKTSEYRNRAEESKNRANEYLNEITNTLSEIKAIHNNIFNQNEKSLELINNIKNLNITAQENDNELNNQKNRVLEYVKSLENIFEDHPDLDSELTMLEEFLQTGEEKSSKIDVLYKASVSKKQEIDQLYFEIQGYEDKDEDGETYKVEGLKSKLESSYKELENQSEKLQSDINFVKDENLEQLQELISSNNKNQIKQIDNWEKKYKKLEEEIANLLPNALTAGLSSAYSNKKKDEEEESKKLVKRFNTGLAGLVLVSIIPFIISYKSFLDGIVFEEIILRLPRVVASILPLYIPVLWLAYSANKKMNLSKRLIEEYTHKEVLSKTFEGLSKQVNNLDDEAISSELKIKLLYNILEISSENPGKLISDYKKSDHPLMDALEKSTKLSKAVDKLENIPGLNKISKILENRSSRIVKEQTEIIEKALDNVD